MEECFPSPKEAKDGEEEPRLFQFLPVLKEKVTSFIRDHCDELSVEAVHKAIHETLLRDLYSEYRIEQISNKCEYYALHELLEFCGLKTLCEFTVWRWMKSLGCEFNEQKESYFTDKHEYPENKNY